MTNPTGYKNTDIGISDLCNELYKAFGQYAVIDLIEQRQALGELSDVEWADCDGCDYWTPIWESTCLVCGSR